MDRESLGKKLTQAHADKGKIFFRAGIRWGLALLIIAAGLRSRPLVKPVSFLAGFVVFLLAAAVAAFLCWPLRHLRDYIEFYENGLCYCGRSWSFSELGEISFREVRSNRSFFADIYMDSAKRRFLMTYIKDGKKQFNRAYQNIYSDEG